MAKNKKKAGQPGNLSPANFIRQRGRSIPLEKCLLSLESLQECGEGFGYVIRRHEGGKHTIGAYLIDKWCTGVKDAFYYVRMEDSEYRNFMDNVMRQSVEEVEYEVLHNWIFGAVEFAAEAGIAPHRDFAVAKYLLEDDEDENIPIIEYEFGDNGKHHLVTRSAEEAAKYLPALHRTLGDNFLYTLYDDTSFYEDDEPSFEAVPDVVYSYKHPEYPSSCTFACKSLERILTGPNEVPSKLEVSRLLKLDHAILKNDLESFIYKVLHDTADITEEEVTDDGLMLIIALLLLGEVGDSSSVGVVLEVMRQSKNFNEHNFGDWTEDILAPVLARLGHDSLDELFTLVERPGLYNFLRMCVFPAVGTIAEHYPGKRGECIDWFRRVLKLYTESLRSGGNGVCDSDTAAMLLGYLCDLRATELVPEIRELFSTGRVDVHISGDLDDVLYDIDRPSNYYRKYSWDLYKFLDALR